MRARCALKERMALACLHASGAPHPKDAVRGREGGWVGSARAPTKKATEIRRF